MSLLAELAGLLVIVVLVVVYGRRVMSRRLARETERAERERALRQELDAERIRLVTVLEQSPVAILLAEAPSGRVLLTNARIDEIVGRDVRVASVDQFLSELPALRADGRPCPAEERPTARALHRGETVRDEMLQFVRPDGTRRVLSVNAAPIRDADGRIVAALAMFSDITASWQAQRELRRSQNILRGILGGSSDAIYVKDRDGRYLAVSDMVATQLGIPSDEIIGKTNFDLLPRHIAERLRAIELRVLESGGTERSEDTTTYFGERRDFITTRGAWRDASGEVAGIVAIATDITERKRREDEARLLADAGRALARSLDYRTTLDAVAHLAVPTFADWCGVEMAEHDADGNDRLVQVAVAHRDPEKVRWVREMNRRYPPRFDRERGTGKVIATGQPEFIAEITDETLVASARGDEELLALLRALGMRSVIIVPLIVREKAVGAVTFISSESGRRYTERDVTIAEELVRRAAIAIESAELYREAVGASSAKSAFLATMSHELRTPLNAIIGYESLLETGITGEVTEAQQRQLKRIKSSALHLLALIDEVLSYSRLEAGQETVRLAPVDVAAALDEAAAFAEPLAAAKGITLRVVPPSAPLVVNADANKLRQILINLLGNAVKFTPVGEVTLRATTEDDAVCFEVRDTGIGIPAHELERIFEPFVQVEAPSTRTIGGTGLGLSVTRQLAEMMGGTVKVESRPGEGSAFSVRLPRRG